MDRASEIIEKMKKMREYRTQFAAWAAEVAKYTKKHPILTFFKAPKFLLDKPSEPEGGWWDDISCDSSDCEAIIKQIRANFAVIKGLHEYTDYSNPPPKPTQLANAAGYKSDTYDSHPRCVQKVIDEMESFDRTLAPTLVMGLAIWDTETRHYWWKNIEIHRSSEFTELLLALLWWCCGDELYRQMQQEWDDFRKNELQN